jgi:hypothetical protein
MRLRQVCEVCSILEASVDPSLRRHGQILVAVGAVLGALTGTVLGLAVEDLQASTTVAAPRPARAAALAATPPSGQPTAAQPTGPGNQADGDVSTARQRSRSVYRPDKGQDRVHKDSKRERKKDNEQPRKRAKDKPGKDNADKDNGQ